MSANLDGAQNGLPSANHVIKYVSFAMMQDVRGKIDLAEWCVLYIFIKQMPRVES